YYYTLANNVVSDDDKIDESTLLQMFEDLRNTNLAPFCWFKISLGMDSLKIHPFWKIAIQYDTLQIVLENYNKYIQMLIEQKEKEDKYRIY
ncbi:MAG: hypothetical protein ACTSVZ_13770, partial [Promethearchaeota archaeon]